MTTRHNINHKGRFIKQSVKSRIERCTEIIGTVNKESTDSKVTESTPQENDHGIRKESVNPNAYQNSQKELPDHANKKKDADDPKDENNWKEGRRIVELELLAKGLSACEDCNQPLSLSNTECESKQGLASILYVRCQCGVINSLSTSKSHREEGKIRGKPIYDVNSKAAIGMYHAGMGHTHVESFLTTVGVPTMHHKSMKRREREVLEPIHKVATESCNVALEEEMEALRLKSSLTTDADINQPVPGQFKYDMGWQKRGSGRAYDSPSGVGTLMGNVTGKIVAYDIRSKGCRTCHYHEGKTAPPHNCPKNWSGSSKAMEPDVAVTVVKQVQEKGVTVGTMVMDDDTTTLSRIKAVVENDVVKWSDLNHTKKHLGNSLYALAKHHKQLTTAVIKALQRWFSYAIKQNQGDTDGVREALTQIVPHAFGVHETCGTWCTYAEDPENYQHRTLPHGHDLQGESLRKDLESIFQVFVNNAEKIAPGASTKEVESFNNMIASKAPKRCHYSASESLRARVDCAAAQKNLGHSYIQDINASLSLSPGSVSAKCAEKRDKKRKALRELENSREYKKRKLELKTKKKIDQTAKETREGTTYKSACATKTDLGLDNEIQEIPPPTPPVKTDLASEKFSRVFFDLETGGLSTGTDITQIAAISGNHKFSQYIAPVGRITPQASEVTGLTCHGGVLMLNGKPVPSVPILVGLSNFLAWLTDIGPCVLIGHNVKFDARHIAYHLKACRLVAPFVAVVCGFVDTLPLFKEVFPDEVNYKQETLVASVLKEEYDAHNAVDDVEALAKLLDKASVSDIELKRYGFSAKSACEHQEYMERGRRNAETLGPLLENKVISKQIASKTGTSGLQLRHLKLAVERAGFEGLRGLLSEDVEGKPRVTRNNKIITRIYAFLSD